MRATRSSFTALLSGFVAFVVATATVVLVLGEQDCAMDAMTIGGLIGGAVALSVWLSADHRRPGGDAPEAEDHSTQSPE